MQDVDLVSMSRTRASRSLPPESQDDLLAQRRGRAIAGADVADLLDEELFEDEVTSAVAAVIEMTADDGDLFRGELLVEVRIETLEAVVAVHIVLHRAGSGAARVFPMPCSFACS